MPTTADILIVTVTDVEGRAVMDAFREVTGKEPKHATIAERTYLDLGEINGERVFMAVCEMGSGGVGGSQESVRKGIESLSPFAVFMVGIAFGVDGQKQAIGDILVSERLLQYEPQRRGTTKKGRSVIIDRGDRPHAAPSLINRLKTASLNWEGAKVRFGLVLSGAKLVDNVGFRDQLLGFEPEAIGGEMEGDGLYVACQNLRVDWILVKGICDWADGLKSVDKDARQELAARNAVGFVLHALKQGPLKAARKRRSKSANNLTKTSSEKPIKAGRSGWFLAHPYLMPPNFTGRATERGMLTQWLNSDNKHPLLSLRALGGFGKSALVWHWLMHDVDPAKWPHVVWWSFYEGNVTFEQFLSETLHYVRDEKYDPKNLSPKEQLKKLLGLLHQPGKLLVLDGFERELRAFGGLGAAYQGDDEKPEKHDGKPDGSDRDCISPLAEDFLRNVAVLPELESKVLLTTRLNPRVLEARGHGIPQGYREEVLHQMQPDDAIAFFRSQGIRGTRAEIEAACTLCGYHPLSLSLLTGLIVRDFEQPLDIAAAKRIDVSGDLVQRKHHVLEAAYNSLIETQRTLLGRIACFRSPVKYDTLKELAKTSHETIAAVDANLRDLVSRGLVHQDAKEIRFDLHPIVRRYAYDRMAAPRRAAEHTRMRDYFAAVPPADKVTRLEDLVPVIELYHHTVRAGQYDEACDLFHARLAHAAHYQLGAYQLSIELLRALFPDGEDQPPRLQKEMDQAWTQNSLSASYAMSGQPHRAVPLVEQYIASSEKLSDKKNHAIGLGNMAQLKMVIGSFRTAQTNLSRRIVLHREIDEELGEAVGYQELGRLLAYRGAWVESENKLAAALSLFEKHSTVQWQGKTSSNCALRELLMQRQRELSKDKDSGHNAPTLRRSPVAATSAVFHGIDLARRALDLAEETARTLYPFERDYVRAHWLLGAAHCVAGNMDEAERHLNEALERCRRINLVDNEGDILIDLARWRVTTGAMDEAQLLAEETLIITERCGYVLQGADAHLELAKLARARGETAVALGHAKEARRLATCDGPPDYTYKVAYDEAGAMLEELGASTR